MQTVAKYSKWVTLVAAIILIISCFMSWTYYPDLGKSFTGWFTEGNAYGRPGKWLSFMAVFAVLAQFLPSLFLKRASLLLMGLNAAYAFFTFVKFNRSYSIVNPEPQVGIYVMLVSSLLLLVAALFPSGTVNNK
jgi:hypothetical protein